MFRLRRAQRLSLFHDADPASTLVRGVRVLPVSTAVSNVCGRPRIRHTVRTIRSQLEHAGCNDAFGSSAKPLLPRTSTTVTMKYMEIPELASLSRSLQHHSSECTVHTRVEAYSCKSINKEKKLFASLEHSYLEDQAAPRSLPSSAAPLDDISPFGHLGQAAARKTLYLLIATLNVAFPDHSFSTLRPDSFVREQSGAHILNALSTTLISLRARPNSIGESPPRSYASYPPPPDPEPATSSPFFPSSVPTSSSPPNPFSNSGSAPPPIVSGTHPALYKVLDDVIKLSECEVFSYSPDINSDPHAGDSDDDEPESDEETEFSDEEFGHDSSFQSEPEDDYTFSFDEDNDEEFVSVSPPKSRWMHDTDRKRTNSSDDSPLDSPESERPRYVHPFRPRRPRTPLLWSSHWFFYNRKLKRILFITVWARKKAWPIMASTTSALDEYSGYRSMQSGESFKGWAGDVGAGARALGLGLAQSF